MRFVGRVAAFLILPGLTTPLYIPVKDDAAINLPYHITLREGSLEYPLLVESATVEEALQNAGIALDPSDIVSPHPQTGLRDGMRIIIQRPRRVRLTDGINTWDALTHAPTVADLTAEQGIELGPQDRTDPAGTTELKQGMLVILVRISEKEALERHSVPFDTITKEDPVLPFRERIIEQQGKAGVKEILVRIRSENGIEVRRRVLETRILEPPRPEIVRLGTFISIGRTEDGWASWYRFGRELTAASTTFPRGTYLRVTNYENSKTIIVKVNDYGPSVPGRVIDLNADAFKKLAPLSKGVIPVIVEEIL